MKSGVLNACRDPLAKSLALAAIALPLSGCMGAPTYGTGKPADEQLLNDITGIISLGPKNKEQIEYKPRPELVKPADKTVLPPPQESVVASANSAWPESPEQRRARVRAEATLGRDDINFKPEVVDGVVQTASAPPVRRTRGDDVSYNGSTLNEGTADAQRKEFNRRVQEGTQGSPTARKYLSEPPLAYRQPSATAPAGDVGEDEWRKQKRREAGTKKTSGWGLGDLWPF